MGKYPWVRLGYTTLLGTCWWSLNKEKKEKEKGEKREKKRIRLSALLNKNILSIN